MVTRRQASAPQPVEATEGVTGFIDFGFDGHHTGTTSKTPYVVSYKALGAEKRVKSFATLNWPGVCCNPYRPGRRNSVFGVGKWT